MKHFIKIAFIVMLLITTATSCTYSSNEPSGDSYVRFYRDPVTNVEYIIYIGAYEGVITPRLNPDGTPYVCKENETNNKEE